MTTPPERIAYALGAGGAGFSNPRLATVELTDPLDGEPLTDPDSGDELVLLPANSLFGARLAQARNRE